MQFNIKDSAKERISSLLTEKPKGNFFRISVLGGGCNGYEYKFEFDNKLEQDDFKFGTNNLIIIDKISAPFLHGSTLEYIDEIGNAKFNIINPNADSNCGCGNSFSINNNIF